MFGAGVLFVTSGTLQYGLSVLAMETSIGWTAWALGNSTGVMVLYVAAVMTFFEHVEDFAAKEEERRAAATAHVSASSSSCQVGQLDQNDHFDHQDELKERKDTQKGW